MQFNYQTLKALAESAGVSVKNVLALAQKNDPFYVGTPAQVDRGQWFATYYRRAGYSTLNVPHLRRVHYWIVSQSPAVIDAHTALGDCQMTLAVCKAMAAAVSNE